MLMVLDYLGNSLGKVDLDFLSNLGVNGNYLSFSSSIVLIVLVLIVLVSVLSLLEASLILLSFWTLRFLKSEMNEDPNMALNLPRVLSIASLTSAYPSSMSFLNILLSDFCMEVTTLGVGFFFSRNLSSHESTLTL